jgi:hypothetical protein
MHLLIVLFDLTGNLRSGGGGKAQRFGKPTTVTDLLFSIGIRAMRDRLTA